VVYRGASALVYQWYTRGCPCGSRGGGGIKGFREIAHQGSRGAGGVCLGRRGPEEGAGKTGPWASRALGKEIPGGDAWVARGGGGSPGACTECRGSSGAYGIRVPAG